MNQVERVTVIPEQRREKVLQLLRETPVLSVQELTDALGVSHMTVRRDIAALDREGRAISVPGGVRLASRLALEPSRLEKEDADRPQKDAMAQAAASMVQGGMAIYLDAGTTLLGMVPLLDGVSELTIVTNDFSTLDALSMTRQHQVIHTGGLLDHRNRSAVGRLAAGTLRQLNVDIAFLSSSSWGLNRGVTTPHESKVEPKRAAMSIAAKSVLVAASSKYGYFGTHRIAELDEFEAVITDTQLSASAIETIRDKGVGLILVDHHENEHKVSSPAILAQ